MRDPARIDRILDLISINWKRHPDLRLGQLLMNVAAQFEKNGFFFEDENLEKALLQNFYNETPNN